MFAHRFKNRNDIEILFLTLQRGATRQNRSAINKNRRPVHSRHRHDAGRHVLVAATNRHKTVHALATDHGFDRVGNDLTRHKRVFHALGAHRNAVGNRDGVEHHPLATGRIRALAGLASEFVDVHVARRHLAPSRSNANVRLGKILFLKTNGIKHRTTRRAVRAIKHQAGKRTGVVIHRAPILRPWHTQGQEA